MKRKLALLFFALAALAVLVVAQQPSALLVPLWTGKTYTYPRLGPTLAVANGQLDALIPPAVPGPQGPQGVPGPQGPAGPQGIPGVTPRRHVDVLLTYDATAGGWPLPAPSATGLSITNVAVYVNGLRYHASADYTLAPGLIKPAPGAQVDPSFTVTCDYDEQ